jgi:hypothetical protein
MVGWHRFKCEWTKLQMRVCDHSGSHVVTVAANHTVHFVPVTIGKDMGKEVEILNGMNGSEPLVSSPSDLLNEGDHVEVR